MTNILRAVEVVNNYINAFVWSPFIVAIFLGTGLYFSVRTGFMQVFKFKSIMRNTIGRTLRKQPANRAAQGVTPFQALSAALAGTLGTGNIAGVAAAITIGGPGTIFWMWVSAFLGMMTKYAEIVLAIRYRTKSKTGEWSGGPMMYIEKGLGAKWLSCIYALFGIAASFGVGNMAQANSISSAMSVAFDIPPLITGITIAVVVGMVIAGGIRQITFVTEKTVPLMSVLYIASALVVIFCHFKSVPRAAMLIFSGAFTPCAPIGGFVGSTVALAVQKGISRGVFTNEAGLGSASIAHAAADTDCAARQGMWGIFEVFFDTIVMCSITAFAILVTDVWASGASGAALTAFAFDTVMYGFGKYVIAISLAFFAFASILAWSYYGKKCVEYLAGERFSKLYILVFLLSAVLGSVLELKLVWEISDSLNGLMALPNIIALIGLSGVVIKITKEDTRRMKL